MSNGIAGIFAAASFVFLAACDSNGVSQQPREDLGSVRNNHSFSVRYQVDSTRERIWWLTRDGVSVHSASMPERVAVALPGWLWVGAPYSCLPDLALGPKGEAVITSNVVSTLWRVDPETLAVSVHRLALNADADKDVGFSGLVYSSEHGAFFGVSDVYGSLWNIDAQLKTAEKIALSMPIRNACRVALGARLVPQDTGRMVALCVRAPQKDWTVDLVLAHRAGYVRGAPCTDLPWRLGQLSLNDR